MKNTGNTENNENTENRKMESTMNMEAENIGSMGNSRSRKHAVVIKSNKYGITIFLDPQLPFEELKQKVAEKFQASADFFGSVQMAVSLEGRVLSEEEQWEVLETITENSQIQIVCIVESDAEREEFFKQSMSTRLNELSAQNGQFYKGMLRSGQVLETETSIVILGDVNPGAKIISKGNIIILGALKGIAYAGAAGNNGAFVVALEMNPCQIQIADIIARSSDEKKKIDKEPKIAFIENGNIYIEPLSRDILKIIH